MYHLFDWQQRYCRQIPVAEITKVPEHSEVIYEKVQVFPETDPLQAATTELAGQVYETEAGEQLYLVTETEYGIEVAVDGVHVLVFQTPDWQDDY